MASTVINVIPAGAKAVGAVASVAPVTLGAAVSQVKLSFQRNAWPVAAVAVAAVVRAQCQISYDGGVTWVLPAGFTAPGGSISATESAVMRTVKPEKGFPRQIRLAGNILSALNTQIDFTVS